MSCRSSLLLLYAPIRSVLLGVTVTVLAASCGGGSGDGGAPSNASRSVDSEQTVQQVMVDVPAGEFTAGSDEYSKADMDERKRKFTLKAYKIDKYETTNAMYKRFLDSIADPAEKKARTPRNDSAGMGGWSEDGWYPMGEADVPVSNVTYGDAEAFAKWAGKRLPQRPEWEKAARGTDERQWPWGNEFDPKKANVSPDVLVAKKKKVGSFPEGESPFGCMDMAGNVAERTSTYFDKKHPKDGGRLVCGGSFLEMDAADTKSHRRLTATDDEVKILYGFRCVQD
jgi:serine/threonine-protein kinase